MWMPLHWISVPHQVIELLSVVLLVFLRLLLEKADVILVHRGANSSQQLSSQHLGQHLTLACLILQHVLAT